MHRLAGLADRKEGYVLQSSPSFKSVVPLVEIIAEAVGMSPDSLTVEREYMQVIKNVGNEFKALLDTPEDELKEKCPPQIAKGIINMRKGNVSIMPGYDGEYGKVKVFKEGEGKQEKQLSFF